MRWIVEAEWRRTVAARARRRRVGVATGLAVAATIVAAVGIGLWRLAPRMIDPSPAARVAQVAATAEIVIGSVRHRPQPQAEPAAGRPSPREQDSKGIEGLPLRIGDRVAVGAALETGAKGRVALRLAQGPSLRIDRGARVRILAADSVALEAGAVYLDSGALAERGAPVEVRTPLGVVREIGTQFEVRLESDGVRVRVREGSVELAGASRARPGPPVEAEPPIGPGADDILSPPASIRVDAGEELRLDAAGRIERGTIASFGELWSWVEAVTPLPRADGRTLREFLDWAARERGWRLVFDRPELAATAASAVVEGSIEGMTLEESLEALLATSNLGHRVDGGALVITARAGL